MELITDMQAYFKGERDLAIIMVPFGLAMIALAYYLWLHYKGGFTQSFMVSAFVIGVGLTIAGTVIMVKGGMDINKNAILVEQDVKTFVDVELERVSNMNQKIWPTLKILWAALIVGSLMVIFAINHDMAKGISLAVLLGASVFMIMDILAERRAVIYEESLRLAHE